MVELSLGKCLGGNLDPRCQTGEYVHGGWAIIRLRRSLPRKQPHACQVDGVLHVELVRKCSRSLARQLGRLSLSKSASVASSRLTFPLIA
jgi:hypothetical protein